MNKSVRELIEKLGGQLLIGDPATVVTGVEEVDLSGPLHLVFGENESSAQKAAASQAGAAVVPLDFIPSRPIDSAVALIAHRQPRLWFAQAARLLHENAQSIGVHPAAVVAPTARLDEGVLVGPTAVIGDHAQIGAFTRIEAGAVIGDRVTIGAHGHIHPRAVIYPGTEMGDRVIIHAGAILGADGFGYVRDRETGVFTQFPQQGRLIIENDVEIGANSTIDRGALAETRIRRGAKLDNLVHVGHNCDVGEDVVIAAQTGISGSSSIGKGAILAGQVGIGDHAHVGAGVILGGQAGVLSGKTVDTTGTVLWGTPAKPLREYLREIATLARLASRKKD